MHIATAADRSDAEPSVSRLGVFVSPSTEQSFRRRHLAHDLWLARVCVTVGAARVIALAPMDHIASASHQTFSHLLAYRVLFVIFSAWTLWTLRAGTCPARADRILGSWCLLLAALTSYLLTSRPPSDAPYTFLIVAMVLAVYCVVPLPLTWQLAVAVPASALTFCGAAAMAPSLRLMLGGTSIMANAVGIVVSAHRNRQRRLLFAYAAREREARTQLERALAEVRTLRGMLCMCAWCKRIRNEAEAWQPVDAYVEQRSDATFTHGICPECLRTTG